MMGKPRSSLRTASVFIGFITLAVLACLSPGYGKIKKEEQETLRVNEVRKLTDQAQLARIAVEDGSAQVRKAAVEGLNDQVLLARIALEDKQKYGLVREAAVQRLTDQGLLATIAAGDKRYGEGVVDYAFPRIRTAAVEHLTNQAALVDVALEGEPEDHTKYGYVRDEAKTLRRTAVRRILDQKLLMRVALEAKVQDTRIAALDRLKDAALLVKVAKESPNAEVRDAAGTKLSKALFDAATQGDAAALRSLLDDGAAVDSRDENGHTALMLASENGHAEAAQVLLGKGADVNATNVIASYVLTPNGGKAYPGNTTSVEEIAALIPGSVIKWGATETALSLATKNGHQEVRDLLIGAGAK